MDVVSPSRSSNHADTHQLLNEEGMSQLWKMLLAGDNALLLTTACHCPMVGSLFVGDLSPNCTESMIRNAFYPYGQVLCIDIKRDKKTNHHLGYAFVHMDSQASAARAKAHLHRTPVGDRAIRIGWAIRNSTLFVGNIRGQLREDELLARFGVFGPLDVQASGLKNAQYGFVRFQSRHSAEIAKKNVDRTLPDGTFLHIGWGEGVYVRHVVHVCWYPFNAIVHLPSLHQYFSMFGIILSLSVPTTTTTTTKSKHFPRNFCFIHYSDTDEGELSAANAIAASNGIISEPGFIMLRCHYGMKEHRQGREREGIRTWQQEPSIICPTAYTEQAQAKSNQ
jgi:hypothetical protein